MKNFMFIKTNGIKIDMNVIKPFLGQKNTIKMRMNMIKEIEMKTGATLYDCTTEEDIANGYVSLDKSCPNFDNE